MIYLDKDMIEEAEGLRAFLNSAEVDDCLKADVLHEKQISLDKLRLDVESREVDSIKISQREAWHFSIILDYMRNRFQGEVAVFGGKGMRRLLDVSVAGNPLADVMEMVEFLDVGCSERGAIRLALLKVKRQQDALRRQGLLRAGGLKTKEHDV